MIALYIAAAGIVAVAVALLVARTPAKLRTADQRGITLQTLIVTAVLVLMAGAAGVVIIAITNNAQDNLEGQNSGIDARCEPWEIFDPTLDAAGRGGGNSGIDSSASGCVRVCYVRYQLATDAVSNAALMGIKLQDDTDGDSDPEDNEGFLMFSRGSELIDVNTTATDQHTLPVNGERSVDPDANGPNGTGIDEKQDIPTITVDGSDITGTALNNYVIKVASNQRYCHVWNNTDDREEFRSRN